MASLTVLFYHLFPHIAHTVPGSFLARLQRVLNLGWSGVDLFFVLSGFLIAGILIDNRSSSRYFSTFYGRRICRIFPLYALLVLGYTTARHFGLGQLGSLTDRDVPAWTYWTFLQNIAMAVLGTFGAIWVAGTWSLAVEEQFYLILPAVIRKWGAPENLFKIALVLIAAGPVSRVLVGLAFRGGQAEFVNYFLLPTRMDSLGAGVLIAVLYRHKGRLWESAKRFSTPVCLISLLLLIGMCLRQNDPRKELFGYTACAGLYAALLVISLQTNLWSRVLETGPMRWAGRISYSTYLLHPILLRLSFGNRAPVLATGGDFVRICIAGLASLALASVLWSVIEKPAQDAGHRRFRYGTAVAVLTLGKADPGFGADRGPGQLVARFRERD